VGLRPIQSDDEVAGLGQVGFHVDGFHAPEVSWVQHVNRLPSAGRVGHLHVYALRAFHVVSQDEVGGRTRYVAEVQ